MLGDTVTLNLGTIADPDEITLKKINQDGYSAEYRLKDSEREHVLLIRHSKEKNKLKGKSVDRHNVTYTQNVFPTELAPLGETIQAYTVFRVNPDSADADVSPVATAVTQFASENAEAILGWES
jgi:hypothetical protein